MAAHKVYLALGANQGDRAGALRAAYGRLRRLLDAAAASGVYETEPMYVLEQPRFLNAVCTGTTTLAPHDLLRETQRIEADLGRERLLAKGPRSIDIDILLYGRLCLRDSDLVIPHPAIAERAFVLVPLLELDPDLADPLTGASYRASLDTVGRSGVCYVGPLDA